MWQCDMYDTVQISIQKKKKEGKKEKYLNRKKKKYPFFAFSFFQCFEAWEINYQFSRNKRAKFRSKSKLNE